MSREQKEKKDAQDRYWKVNAPHDTTPGRPLGSSLTVHFNSFIKQARPTKRRRIWRDWPKSARSEKRRRRSARPRLKVRSIGC